MTEVFEALMPECLGYGMPIGDFYLCDHGEIGSFLEGHRERERREYAYALSASLRTSMSLANAILSGLDGKQYRPNAKEYPELFGSEKRNGRQQSWEEQEAILRKFLKMKDRVD